MIRRPDDWHLHLRDGAMLEGVLPHSRHFARAIVMPNLVPPVRTGADARAYRERIDKALPKGQRFTPLMTLYLTEETDRRVLVAAMRLARAILKSKPLELYYDHEDFPGDKVQSDDEMLAAAKERGTTTFHPMGTCRMGPDSDPTSVVDDELRVRGLEGLRVVDASVMPMMLSANINAATMMIADKASDMIRGKAAPQPIILAR